jgi:C4-dicarboxylate transporter, DctQ subunit
MTVRLGLPLLARVVRRCEDALLVAVLTVLTGAALAQIVVRNVLGSTLLWTEPLVRLLVLWGGLLGALVAVREDKHIRFETALSLCPARGRRWLRLFTELTSAAVCALLAAIAVRFVRDESGYGGQAFLGLACWQVQLIFPLVFAAMSVRFLARGLGSWRDH